MNAAAPETRRGRVVILTSADMVKYGYLTMGVDFQSNVLFFHDLIETFALDARLLKIGLGAAAAAGMTRPLSQPTREILGELMDVIRVRYYASADMPDFLPDIRPGTLEVLKEMETLAGGRFKYEMIDPVERAREYALEKAKEYEKTLKDGKTPIEPRIESIEDLWIRDASAKTDAELAAERRMKAATLAEKSGRSADEEFRHLLHEDWKADYLTDLKQRRIYSIPAEHRQRGLKTEIYSALEVLYRDRRSEVIFHHQIGALEYELMKKILKVMESSKPRVVFFDGRKPGKRSAAPAGPAGAVSSSEHSKTVDGLGEFFEIQEIDLKEGDSLPDRISVLIVAQPHELEARQIYEISRAISGGTPTVLLVSGFSADLSPGAGERRFPLAVLRHNLEDLFVDWGVSLGKELLASRECASGPAVEAGQPAGAAQRSLPILLKASTHQAHPLMRRTASLVFPAAVGLSINRNAARAAGIEITELADSGYQSYVVRVTAPEANPSVLDHLELHDPSRHQGPFVDPQPLAVLLEGSFPSPFSDREPPAWQK